jgi:hypothetical protein
MQGQNKKTVLIVDNNEEILQTFRAFLNCRVGKDTFSLFG